MALVNWERKQSGEEVGTLNGGRLVWLVISFGVVEVELGREPAL